MAGWGSEREGARENMGKYQKNFYQVRGKRNILIIIIPDKINTEMQRCIYSNRFLLGIKNI